MEERREEERREEEEKVEVEEREERMVQPWNSGTNQGDCTIDDPTITSGPSGGDAGLGGATKLLTTDLYFKLTSHNQFTQ